MSFLPSKDCSTRAYLVVEAVHALGETRLVLSGNLL